MTKNDQPAREANLDAIVAYFEGGIKESSEQLGIELEHTLVRADGSPVSYREENGVRWLLEQLLADYPEATRDPEGDLLGVARPGEAVTIEPAAQVELSAGPFTRLADPGLPPHRVRRGPGAHPQATLQAHEQVPGRHRQVRHLHDARQRLHPGVHRLLVGGRLPA